MLRIKSSDALLAALLLIVTFLVYLPCLHGQFLWDDDAYISKNAELATPSGLHDMWLKPGAVQQYYPVTFTVLWIEHQLWGLNTIGYHLTNVIIHGLNALLFWLILDSLGLSGAWIAAWLFALHPVMAESVAWMTELKNVLSTFFYLLTVLVLIKMESDKSSWRRQGIAFALFLCALLSKSVTVTLPVVFLLVTLWVKGTWDNKQFYRMLPMIGLGVAMALVTIYYEHHWVRAQGAQWDFTLSQHVVIAGRAFWFYLGKLIRPSPLSFIYPRWDVPAFTGLSYLYALLGFTLLATAAYGQKWWGKLPFGCLLFYADTLAPTLGFSSFYFMRFSFVADHFQYLASLGIFTLAGWLMSRAMQKLQIPPPSPLGVVVVAMLGVNLALATNRQAKKYSDSLSLWQDTLRFNPDSAIAHHNLGIALTDKGRWNEAVAHLRTAEALDPTFPQTHLALAFLASKAHRIDDARHQYKEAIRLGVTDPVVLKDYAALPPTRQK